jgi:hypothetical protein
VLFFFFSFPFCCFHSLSLPLLSLPLLSSHSLISLSGGVAEPPRDHTRPRARPQIQKVAGSGPRPVRSPLFLRC